MATTALRCTLRVSAPASLTKTTLRRAAPRRAAPPARAAKNRGEGAPTELAQRSRKDELVFDSAPALASAPSGASLARQGGGSLFLFAALISINLAVLNALPLPLLDGGQFALLLVEGLRGRPLPERFQHAFMQSGFVLLVGLSVVLIVKDTSQLPLVQQLFVR